MPTRAAVVMGMTLPTTLALPLAALLAASPSPSPSPAPTKGSAPPERTGVAPDSPRASLAEYLNLCRAGRYADAARHLNVAEEQRARAADLARRLKAVLDRHLWLDLDMVSPRPEGEERDGLPRGTEELGVIPRGSDPVRLVRSEDAEGARWVFSRGTVGRIDGWYEALPDRWIRDRLPDILLRPGPRDVLWWQWLALPLLALLAAGIARPLSWATRSALGRLFAPTETDWDNALLRRLVGPLTLGWALVLANVLVPWLGLYAPAEVFLRRILGASAVVTVFWASWRVVDIGAEALRRSRWGEASASARSLVFVGGRLAKVGVLALGLVAALSELGYPVAGLLAGMGIGGLALALAAQKTVENLFGSFALALDRPFGVGDFVKVEDFVGTVEAIGLRSTNFRTLDRTLITIPNGRLADMRLECFSARDRMRLACTIGLVYGTTAPQMRRVLEGIEAALRAHPRIWADAVVVRFKELAASSLDIEVMAWFETSEWGEFQLIRQEALLQFMEVVEDAGTSFAFPTRTVHVVPEAPSAPGAAASA